MSQETFTSVLMFLRTPFSLYQQFHSLFSGHSFDVMCRDDFPSCLGEECLTDCNEVSSLAVRESFTPDFTL